MDLGLIDKVAVITGGSAGIGLAVADGLAAERSPLNLRISSSSFAPNAQAVRRGRPISWWRYAKDNLISELQCAMSFELGVLANQKVY